MAIATPPAARRAWSPYAVNLLVGNAVLIADFWAPLHHQGITPPTPAELALGTLHTCRYPSATALILIFASRWVLRRRPDVRWLAALSIVMPLAVLFLSVLAEDLVLHRSPQFSAWLALLVGWPLAALLMPVNFLVLGRGLVPLRRARSG